MDKLTKLTTRVIDADTLTTWLRASTQPSAELQSETRTDTTGTQPSDRSTSPERFTNLAKTIAEQDRAILDALAAFDRGDYHSDAERSTIVDRSQVESNSSMERS